MRLSHADFDLLQRSTLEFHAYRDLDEFWSAVPGIFLKAFSAEYFVMTGFKVNPAAGQVALAESRESSGRITADALRTMQHFMPTHPFTTYFLQTQDPTALKLSDFFSSTQLEKAPLYQEGYRPLGVRRVLTMAISSRLSNAAGISVARNGTDFTERDRLMMNLLRPHFDLACRNAEKVSEGRNSRARPLVNFNFSSREAEVARWLGEGKTNPEIAIILAASVRTVEKHVARIIEKVGAENRTSAALIISTSV